MPEAEAEAHPLDRVGEQLGGEKDYDKRNEDKEDRERQITSVSGEAQRRQYIRLPVTGKKV